MCSTSDDVQYKSGTSSVQARTYSTNQVHLQQRLIRKTILKFSKESIQKYSNAPNLLLIGSEMTEMRGVSNLFDSMWNAVNSSDCSVKLLKLLKNIVC